MTDTSTSSSNSRHILFRVGWILLLVLLGFFAATHIAGIWFIADSG